MITKTKRSLVGLIVVMLVLGPMGVTNGISATSKGSVAMQSEVQTAALGDSTKVKTTVFTAKKIPKPESRNKNRGTEKGMLLTLLALVAGQQGTRR